MSEGASPVASAAMETLNRGTRYRVGVVPESIVAGDLEAMAEALLGEKVDMLIVDNYSHELPADFPVAHIMVLPGDDEQQLIDRLMRECPDYAPERSWAQALGETFDEKRTVPPPMPGSGAVPPAYQQAVQVPPQEQPQPAPGMQPEMQPGNQPGMQPGMQHQQRPVMPETSLLWSILATILCCVIPGIIAIVYSTMVSSKYFAGDYAGAEKASRRAQIWVIVSIVLGCVFNALYVPLMLMSSL